MDKYICENDIIYKLDEQEHYNPVVFLDCYEVKGEYAKVRLNYLLENNLGFLVQLDDEDKFDEYFENYQKEMYATELQIVRKSKKQDAISNLMARELLMYQDIS